MMALRSILTLLVLVGLASCTNFTGNISVTQFSNIISAAELKSDNISVVAKFIGDLLDKDQGSTWNVVIRQYPVSDSSFWSLSYLNHYLNW